MLLMLPAEIDFEKPAALASILKDSYFLWKLNTLACILWYLSFVVNLTEFRVTYEECLCFCYESLSKEDFTWRQKAHPECEQHWPCAGVPDWMEGKKEKV